MMAGPMDCLITARGVRLHPHRPWTPATGRVIAIKTAASVAPVPPVNTFLAPEKQSRVVVVEGRRPEPAVLEKRMLPVERRSDNWLLNIMGFRWLWPEREEEEAASPEEGVGGSDQRGAADAGDRCFVCGCADDSEGCVVVGEDEEASKVFDQETFSRLLRRASSVELRLYAKMSCLGCLAYELRKLEMRNLLNHHGLRFVTSSIEIKRRKSDQEPIPEEEEEEEEEEAAASFTAATASSSVETKRAAAVVAEDLNSADESSSTCEWYICDDDDSATRYVVFQGSETLDSWKANLLFEPIQFEGLDVPVHRGIYELAKGIYNRILPDIKTHLRDRGGSATLQFTGHSLGGSLAMLLNLMLLIRGDAPASSLLPVITFGAPYVMYRGDDLLRKLGLPKTHVQAIVMHRDIVPRAFSCNYPDHVVAVLKLINGNFRNHPCLVNQKYLYAPMGSFVILQPDEKFSPNHHLLPPGSGLYILDDSRPDSDDDPAELLRGAQSAFLNSPHPLEVVSVLSAYGSRGTVFRNHDASSYLESLRSVILDEDMGKAKKTTTREPSPDVWWPLAAAKSCSASRESVINGGGKQTFQHFGMPLASQDMQLVAMILSPTKLLSLHALISS